MPSRNSIKVHAAEQYYHVYNRGANKQRIFHDADDYTFFLHLLKRHLSSEEVRDRYGRPYRHLRDQVEVLSYCLMPNHFHLLILNKESDGMELLMRSLTTAYSMYYNKKYRHSGHLFQGIYKASMIDSDAYLQHIARYVMRNPTEYRTYDYSSYQALAHGWSVEWLNSKLLLETFEGTKKEYLDFIDDYEDYKKTLEDIELELANL